MSEMNQNDEKTSWGIHINQHNDLVSTPRPKWVTGGNQITWKRMGVVIWDEAASKVACLSPCQALDVLDDLRESSVWENDPFPLSWKSYSMPFSEENRKAWRKSENQRSQSAEDDLEPDALILSPEQSRALFLFLDKHQSEIYELAEMNRKQVRKRLGQAYSMILGWRRDRLAKDEGSK